MQESDHLVGEKFEQSESTAEVSAEQQEQFEKWNAAMSEGKVPPFDDSSTWLEAYLEGAQGGSVPKEDYYAEQMRKVIDESWGSSPESDDSREKDSENQTFKNLHKDWEEAAKADSVDTNNDKKLETVGEGEEDDEIELEFLKGKERDVVSGETEKTSYNDELGQASQMAGYGFDAAAKMYGLETVLKEIRDTDEKDRDAKNPIGAIYDRLAPDPKSRRQLFAEIYKDSVEPSKYATEIKKDTPTERIGLDVRNHFYERSADADSSWYWRRSQENVTQNAVDAISSTKRLLDAIENDEDFSKLRERAARQNKEPIKYLLYNDVNSTLSKFFDNVGESLEENANLAIQELTNEEYKKGNTEFLQDVRELAKNEDPTNLLEYVEDIEAEIDQPTADKAMNILKETHPDLELQLTDEFKANIMKLISNKIPK